MSKKIFEVGSVIRLNPKNESYEYWAGNHTAGPFLVMPPDGPQGWIKRLSDGTMIACHKSVNSDWAILDPFLDAAMKANKSNE